MIDKILVWNLRGLGSSRNRLKSLVKKFGVSIVGILEPFAKDDKMTRLAYLMGLPSFCSNAAFDGKIWIFWSDDYDWDVLSMTNQLISWIFRFGEEKLYISFIYAKCNSIERRDLWQSLELIDSNESSWLVVRDFNIIREDSERVGGHPRLITLMEDFNNCIDHCGLLDLQVMGRRLSWCNGHERHTCSWARLDRALINIHFANIFPSAFFEYLNRKTSDHRPMLIHFQKQEVSYSPHTFRFQNMWVSHADFMRCVEEVWKEPTTSVGLLRLAEELKKTKLALRAWNKQVFGHVGQTIKELEERLEVLESRLLGGYDKEVECDFLVTKLELDTWEQREELRLSQLAKKKWLSEGDQNTKFFHAVVNQWRKSKVISNMRLENALAEAEILAALKSISRESSPGPDGFGSGFYLCCWDLIKEDVIDAAKDFFLGSTLPRFYTASYLVFIPKVEELKSFDKFRPISLCSVAYKIFSKVQVQRMTSFLSQLISHEQVFVNGGKRSVQRLLSTLEVYEKWFVEGKFLVTYLGVPLVSGCLTSTHLVLLIEKIRRKIASWKLKLLSQGGRLTLMKHVLACMSTHLLAVLNVPMKVFSRLNSLMSTFFWGDLNGKPRMKWCVWDRICKPYKEGGLGIRNFHEVQRSLHMKFAWRLVTVDNLWTKFFCAKYVKHGHIFFAETRRNASRFWKSIMNVLLDMVENVIIKVREGSSSIWFDRWLASGPLCANRDSLHSNITIKDVWVYGSWDENYLVELIGLDKTKEIMNGVVAGKVGTNITIWKPYIKGDFTSVSAWDLIRVKGTEHLGMDWILHHLLPKKISVYMWKARFNGLALDSRVQLLGIPLASRCNCYTHGHTESLNHVLCNGSIATEVWKTAAITLGIIIGVLLDLIPSIITWHLWMRHCKARMENSAESADNVWLRVKVWISKISSLMVKQWPISARDEIILQALEVTYVNRARAIPKLIYWRKPAEGWIKLNVDGCCRGNPGNCGGGGVIQDVRGIFRRAFSSSFGHGTNNEAELRALLAGISLCKKLGFNQINIESDSTLIVSWLSSRKCMAWYLWDYWEIF
ncbi:hypothetical protein Patl1_37562 [Pistacia atlantica]|nr:hypothetical protein Patl1_37562 [Pistacia atlantica]